MATVVCLNLGNYLGRGAEYVNKLYQMVELNTTVPHEFVCVTDDPTGLDEGIKHIHISPELKGWWGKLYLFKKGLFPEGERMVFFDLDTLILKNIDELLEYQGEMAGLRDFYVSTRWATGVVLWESGKYSHIWDEWNAERKTDLELGDMEFINNLDQGRFVKHLPRLQDLFHYKFHSYKADCHPLPPMMTSVLCFHGKPRPHEVGGWVKKVWNGEKYDPSMYGKMTIEMA